VEESWRVNMQLQRKTTYCSTRSLLSFPQNFYFACAQHGQSSLPWDPAPHHALCLLCDPSVIHIGR
jgi:hypothetical protein